MAVSTAAPDHVVIVVEENHDYSNIVNNSQAQFINRLADEGALFTDYHGVARPSQPNYFAMFSGSTQGVTDNANHSFSAPTLAGQLETAGYSFAGYAEAGSPRKHNPWESFADSKDMGKDFSSFPSDFSKLPTVSFVSPNQLNDMHDGSIARGDQWLEDNLGAYASWAKTHNSLLVVTFDEDGHGENQRVSTIITGDGVSPLKTGQAVNHYSLLHTIESLYGLPALGQAAKAAVMDFGRETSGEPPVSEPPVVQPPVDPPVTPPIDQPPGSQQVSFQQGLNGYAGTIDTMVRELNPNTSHGTATALHVDAADRSTSGRESQGLLQFSGLVGDGANQIPVGAHITKAALTLHNSNAGDGAALHRMLSDWSEQDTWNSLSHGVQADGTEAVAAAAAVTGHQSGSGTSTVDVTSSVQAWVSGAANHGWAFLPSGDDGWDFRSSEGQDAPVLTVDYTVASAGGTPTSHLDNWML